MKSLKNKLLINLGHSFKNPLLFEQALTHGSVQMLPSYERLEFLGDRVLGLVIAELLYLNFPNENEGSLAKRFTYLVSRSMLINIAKELNLSKIIYFEGRNFIADSVLADVCESLIGALYLDGGLIVVKSFLKRYWKNHLDKNVLPPEDSKSYLQEWIQLNHKELPTYKVIDKFGPAHAPIFVVEVSIF